MNNRNIKVIRTIGGEEIVLINDIRFKGRQNINWKKVEDLLKEYIGSFYEITNTAEKINMRLMLISAGIGTNLY